MQSALATTLVNDGISLLDAADEAASLAVDVWLNARASIGTRPSEDSAPPEDADATATEEAPRRGAEVRAE